MRSLFRLRPFFLQPSCPIATPTLRLFSSSSSAVGNVSTSPSFNDLLSRSDLLIPRLCISNHLRDAIRLLEAVLTATSAPPPSFTVLVDHLTDQPDMTDSMALINRLKHNPATQHFLVCVNRALIDCYLEKRRHKEAVKVFNWMLRPESGCSPDGEAFAAVVSGLFDCHVGSEGLRALKEMVRAGLDPGAELRMVVYRGLLRVAMVREGKALDEALEGVRGEGVERALKLIDDIITKWEDSSVTRNLLLKLRCTMGA